MFQGAEEEKLGDGREAPFQKLFMFDNIGVTKPFENPITYQHGRVDTTKTPSPTKPSNLLSTWLSPLVLWQTQLRQLRRGRVDNNPEKVASSVTRKVEVGHIPEGGGENFEQYPEWGTRSASLLGYPTKSGYLTFDPGGIFTINLRILYQDSDSY